MQPVALRTGRFATFDPTEGTPVAITVGRPRFPLGYEIAAAVPDLAPSGSLFAVTDRDEFTERYERRLDRTGVPQLRQQFERIAREHGGPLVLLCFEDLAVTWCHRQVFAAWWTRQTGEPVPEVGPQQMRLDA
ncbi:MAG TPA: DUF488 family protein [Solirubrobacter sp.]|nr:DUF488 family protein [Solirubrobacter sp.]